MNIDGRWQMKRMSSIAEESGDRLDKNQVSELFS